MRCPDTAAVVEAAVTVAAVAVVVEAAVDTAVLTALPWVEDADGKSGTPASLNRHPSFPEVSSTHLCFLHFSVSVKLGWFLLRRCPPRVAWHEASARDRA